MNDHIADHVGQAFIHSRRLERAIYHEARKLGLRRPDLYSNVDRPLHNCLNPAGRAIYLRLSRDVLHNDLRALARRMCESVGRQLEGLK